MKGVSFLTVVFFLFSSGICFSQLKVTGFGGFDLSIPVNKFGVEIVKGDYGVGVKSSINKDFSAGIVCWVLDDFGISTAMGLSYKTYIISHHIEIEDLNLPAYFNDDRHLKVSGANPSVGIVYKHGRFRTGISINQLFRFNKNITEQISYERSVIIDYPHSFPFVYVALKEQIKRVTNALVYTGIKLYVQYTLTNQLNLNVGFEKNLNSITQNYYELRIYTYHEGGENHATILENFYLPNKYQGFNVGLYYLIGK